MEKLILILSSVGLSTMMTAIYFNFKQKYDSRNEILNKTMLPEKVEPLDQLPEKVKILDGDDFIQEFY